MLKIDSQNSKILAYMKVGKSITPIEALNLFGCFRLSGRIHFLKSKGYKITTKIIEHGGKKFAQYSML